MHVNPLKTLCCKSVHLQNCIQLLQLYGLVARTLKYLELKQILGPTLCNCLLKRLQISQSARIGLKLLTVSHCSWKNIEILPRAHKA